MNDEKSREGLRTISNIFVGAASGLLAAMLVLFLLSSWSFHIEIKTVLIGLIFAVFLPCCLDVFGQRGLNLYIVELVMILVQSWSVCYTRIRYPGIQKPGICCLRCLAYFTGYPQ